MKSRWKRMAGVGLVAVSLLALASCTGGGSGTPKAGGPKSAAKDEGEQGHSHERGKMLIADAGKYHALLTAHLAKEGNELDIFFETTAKEPTPVAIADQPFTAQATTGEGDPKELKFEPAPADERPKDERPGTCSHFVAKAPWMKPTDNLLVVAKVTIDGRQMTIRWKDFNPKKYAHHEE